MTQLTDTNTSISNDANNFAQNHSSLTRKSKGFSLLEVLITMVVLAFGMLGVAKLQLTSLRDVQNARYISQANLLVQNMAEHIAANSQALISYQLNYQQQVNATVNCKVSQCSNNNLAKYDLMRWQQRITKSLPSGSGEIRINNNQAQILVYWDENRDGSSGANCPKLSANDLECSQLKRRFK